MKFFHISDLHIGKQLNGYSLRENQEAVLRQIVKHAEEIRPDAVLICGDIYDKTVPSGEAHTMFNRFLEDLNEIRPEIPVFIIAGNHDSPERLQFASAFLESHKIYISVMPPQQKEEHLKKLTLTDEFGPVHFFLLPYTKPGYVRQLLEEDKGEDSEQRKGTYEEAVRAVISRESIDQKERNVLLSHQFYIKGDSRPETCDSEMATVMAGGLDSIDISVLEPFDYVALGHLHGPQKVGRESVRYCGSPYKYSVSEEHHKKSITVVNLGEKGREAQITTIPLCGLQDVRRERGTLEEIIERAEEENCHDFVSVTLTDEKETYNFREKLEELYDHLLEIRVDNQRTRSRIEEAPKEEETVSPEEAFSRFYEAVRGQVMTEEEKAVMREIVREAQEGECR